ncbi:PilZ domain-containing protein [Alkalihalobacillus sp. BA299]|uniref:PilZ domain-containing protein n=1 Tax=Alkalihalobacillus sp. BA299 TaxID=2815938 RepID=UPI0035AB8FA3
MGRQKGELLDGQILDLSPNGIKIKTSVDLPLETELHISFSLNNIQFDVTGTIRWKKDYINYIIEGIQLQNDAFVQKSLINELKLFVK